MASVAAAPPPPPTSQKVATFPQQQQQQQQNQQQNQQQQQQQQEPMRCPRCDSSNTKFCYYNNYSLSQPRHFCKACKRYWTRGGTLRNVPVGGGCRKNKRVKRPHHQTNSSASNSSSSINNNINHPNNLHETSVNSGSVGGHIHDLISSASNPLFYGLPTTNHNHNLMNFPFSRYDLQNPSQINALGLGFSSGLVHNGDLRNGLSMNLQNNNSNNNDNHNNNTNNKQIFQDLISSNNPLLSNYANTTNTSTTSSTTPPTISSLLASTFHMKGGNSNGGGGGNNFQTLMPSYEDGLHMKGNGQGGMFGKEVKMELEGQNRSLDHHWSAPSQNQMDHSNNMGSSSSDPSVIWGSGPNLGAWLDSSNNNNHHHHLGSSVPSLI